MNSALYLLLGLGLGAVVGWAIGWLLGSRRSSGHPSDQRVEDELRAQLSQRNAELDNLRTDLTVAQTAQATAGAERAAARQLLEEQRQLHERSVLEARQAQEKSLADLREAFRALSADALKQTQPEFLRLAQETLARFQESAKGDLAQRQESIKTLVEPLKAQLEAYQRQLQQSESSQSATMGELKHHLESLTQQSQLLSAETLQLRRVLSSNQARGRWGEETLRRVVEAAGMSAHCDFSEQAQSGEVKPDLVVHLPGERVIIVDAKVPDLDFLQALDTADSAKRIEALAQHAARLKATIKALAERDYPRQFPHALDYVVLFVPAESLFSAALEGDRDLIVWAAARQILLATPASLIAILRSVSLSWQQHAQTANAQAIAEAAREFYARMVKFTEHFERIRSGLEKANAAFADAAASYQSRVRPAGERLAELGGGSQGKELVDLQHMDGTPRLPTIGPGDRAEPRP